MGILFLDIRENLFLDLVQQFELCQFQKIIDKLLKYILFTKLEEGIYQ